MPCPDRITYMYICISIWARASESTQSVTTRVRFKWALVNVRHVLTQQLLCNNVNDSQPIGADPLFRKGQGPGLQIWSAKTMHIFAQACHMGLLLFNKFEGDPQCFVHPLNTPLYLYVFYHNVAR